MIKGDASQMKMVAKAIREVKDKELSKALTKGINAAVEPAKAAARDGARDMLPHRGGLAERVAGSKWRVAKQTGKNPGVTLSASLGKDGGGKVALKAIDAGKVRHPVWGHRKSWVLQSVPSGWFTKPLEQLKPKIADDIAKVVREVASALAAKSKGSA